MNKKLASIVGAENVSENPSDIDAYSYCCSDTELKPSIIVWPRNVEQARRVLLFCNQCRTPVVIRGAGTSFVDGCIQENAIVLCSERMNRVLNLDSKNKVIEVESGMKLADLNNSLKSLNLCFPLISLNASQTIGGMVALNAVSRESLNLGRMDDWVEEVEFCDATGKSFYTRKKELVVGKEGLSGFITKVKIKVAEVPTLSFNVFYFDQISDLLGQAGSLRKNKEVYSLEFLDKKTAKALGFEEKYSLLVAYSAIYGKVRMIQDVKDLLAKMDAIPSVIRSEGYYYVEDPCVGLEKTYDLIDWCEKHDARIHGHIGSGVFYVYFQKKDRDLKEVFRSFVKRINGTFGGAFGYGLKNKEFLPLDKKKELMRLKDEYDYNNLLNPNEMIDYR